MNLYVYSRGDPVRLIDSTGNRAAPPVYEGDPRPSDLPPLEQRDPELARKLDALINSAAEPEGPAGGYPVLPEEPPPVGGFPVLPEDDVSADPSSTESEIAYYVILQGDDEGGETNRNTEAGGKAAAFAEGIAEGLGTGIAIRGGLYVIGAVFGGPVATVFGVGLLVYGLYELSTGGAEALVKAGTRIASGEGTAQDYETAGVVLGGIIGGVRGRGRTTNATLEPQPAGPFKNRSGNLEGAAKAARNQPHGPNTTLKRRLPNTLSEELAMEEAKHGAGEVIIQSLKDPRYRGWQKMQHVHRNPDGSNTVIHYIRNPETGYTTDFKFK